MPITTTGVLSAPVNMTFSQRLLSVPVPYMIHNIPAERKKLPKGGGETLRMVRFNPLATAKVPLGNTGITPPAQLLTSMNIDAKIGFYGTYVMLNEQVILTSQCPVLNEAAKRLGISLRQTEDELTRDMLMAGAGVVNAVNGVNGDNPTEITVADVTQVVRALANANAKTILDNIEGEDKFGTAPIRDSYFALASTQLIGDLDATPGFVHKNNYPSQTNILRSEYGSINALRFLLSSIGAVEVGASGLGANVYDIFVVGMEAYASIELDEYSAKFIYRPAIYDSPLAMNDSSGYKFSYTSRILNDLWCLKLRVTLA